MKERLSGRSDNGCQAALLISVAIVVEDNSRADSALAFNPDRVLTRCKDTFKNAVEHDVMVAPAINSASVVKRHFVPVDHQSESNVIRAPRLNTTDGNVHEEVTGFL